MREERKRKEKYRASWFCPFSPSTHHHSGCKSLGREGGWQDEQGMAVNEHPTVLVTPRYLVSKVNLPPLCNVKVGWAHMCLTVQCVQTYMLEYGRHHDGKEGGAVTYRRGLLSRRSHVANLWGAALVAHLIITSQIRWNMPGFWVFLMTTERGAAHLVMGFRT